MFAKFSIRNHFRRFFFPRFRIEKFDKQLLIGTTMRRESLDKKKEKTPNHRQTVDNTENQHKSSHCRRVSHPFLSRISSRSSRFFSSLVSHAYPFLAKFSISMRVILRARPFILQFNYRVRVDCLFLVHFIYTDFTSFIFIVSPHSRTEQ